MGVTEGVSQRCRSHLVPYFKHSQGTCLFIMVLILWSNVVYLRLKVHVLTKKKFLNENEMINDQNDYNDNKQIFIFLFYIVYSVYWYDV